MLRLASTVWQEGNAIGSKNGWRNAQASVLAPTGTIGFMMDCDTTGIEPDFSLVKFKKLVGGGSMQIVNQTIPRALTKLGYPQETIEAVVEYIAEHGHVVDAPGLKPEHYSVFDCAMGERAISPMGHVRMMAAVQPFLSGAISKTVNMPETASIEEVEEIYFEGWKTGLKALAIYRDNCKVGQPFRRKSRQEAGTGRCRCRTPAGPQALAEGAAEPDDLVQRGWCRGLYDRRFVPGRWSREVFLKLGKQGSTLAGVMDAFSIAISIALQYGVPLEAYVSKFVNMRFEPSGMTDDPDIRMAQSMMDYIFRRLALDHLPYEKRAGLGIFTADERAGQLNESTEQAAQSPAAPHESDQLDAPVVPHEMGTASVPASVHSSAELLEAITGKTADAPLCMTCGIKMRPAGSCYVCEGCGSTSGCS